MKRLLVAGRIPPGSSPVWELRLRLRAPAPGAPLPVARVQGGDLTPPAAGGAVVIPLRRNGQSPSS